MTIRSAIPDDFDSIQELNRQIFEYEYEYCEKTSNVDYPYQQAGVDFISNIVNGTGAHAGLVFEKDGRILGYASMRLVSDNDMKHRIGVKQIQLQTLCVDKTIRGQGIGQALVDAVKQWAKERGANRLKVVAYAKNSSAREFYKKQGFQELEIHHEMEL